MHRDSHPDGKKSHMRKEVRKMEAVSDLGATISRRLNQHMAKTLLGEQDSTTIRDGYFRPLPQVIHKKSLLFTKILESNNKQELFTVEVDFDFYRREDGSLKGVVEGVFAIYLFPDLFMSPGAGPSILELNKKLLPRQEVLSEVGGYVAFMKRFERIEDIFPHFLVAIGRAQSMIESLDSK